MTSPVRLRVIIEYDGPQAGCESVIESLARLKISSGDLSLNYEELPSAASSGSTSAVRLPDSSTPGDSSVSGSNNYRKPLKKHGRKSEPILPTQVPTSVELPERASSEPPPNQPDRPLLPGKQHCEAYNSSDGEPCKIQIRASLFPSLCHVHIKAVLKQAGFYSHANPSTLVKFEDWIPAFLSKRTQAGLRKLMAEPPEASDSERGFVYAFEITNPQRPDEAQIKVGYTNCLNRRLNEWEAQCQSKDMVPRGWWPCVPEDSQASSKYVDGAVSLLIGTIEQGMPGKYPKRIERLVHAELEDIATNSLHLTPGFMDLSPRDNLPVTSEKRKLRADRKACSDCGTTHREIFVFKRHASSEPSGDEWTSVVKPIIEKWGSFVEEYM